MNIPTPIWNSFVQIALEVLQVMIKIIESTKGPNGNS